MSWYWSYNYARELIRERLDEAEHARLGQDARAARSAAASAAHTPSAVHGRRHRWGVRPAAFGELIGRFAGH